MAYIDLTYSDGGSRRFVKEDLGERPLFVDEVDASKRFRLIRAVLGGGNGVVFAAQQLDARERPFQTVAVKILRQLDEGPRDRFANERRVLAALNHRSITTFHGSGIHRAQAAGMDVPWIAMHLCGPNLRQHLQERGPIGPGLLRHVGIQICDAVQYVHERDLIHRDLKPANVVWADESSASGVVKLIDFGLAKYTGEDMSGRPLDDFTKTPDFVGPVFFSSPELIAYAENKKHPVDHLSDLFQLGKVLWFLATGRILAGIPAVRHDPTGGVLHGLVSALIADDPADRPDSANVVRAQLQTWEAGRA